MQQSLKQNRDIRGGREKILASKSDYINQLEEQSDPQFESMCEMAPIYVLYPRVVDGFVGTIFQKKPNLTGIEFTDEQKEMNKNVDLLGNSIDKYSENVVAQIMENGFCASLNDYSPKLNRPFVRMINPEQFISFRHNSDDGYPKVSQFIFYDIIEVDDPEDEFSTLTKNQYTVLDLIENPDNNNKKNYRIRIYESVNERDILNTNEKVIFKSSKFPKKGSEFFDDIPLEIHGVENSNLTISKSLLQDISDMNISVIQRTVDQVYMLHWTALPTPVGIWC